MKKIFVCVLIALCVLGLFACSKATAPQENHVSYCQESFFYGKNADFSVRLVGGTGEKMFVADGKSVDVIHFDKLTVVPLHVDLFNESYTFTLVGDKGEVSGTLSKDSFGASYTAEIADIAAIGTPTLVKLTGGQIDESIELTDKLVGSIAPSEAMRIAQETLADKLAADGKEREIYVKYINDTAQEDSPYYWYVAHIASPTDYYSVLVDDKGNVVTVNP